MSEPSKARSRAFRLRRKSSLTRSERRWLDNYENRVRARRESRRARSKLSSPSAKSGSEAISRWLVSWIIHSERIAVWRALGGVGSKPKKPTLTEIKSPPTSLKTEWVSPPRGSIPGIAQSRAYLGVSIPEGGYSEPDVGRRIQASRGRRAAVRVEVVFMSVDSDTVRTRDRTTVPTWISAVRVTDRWENIGAEFAGALANMTRESRIGEILGFEVRVWPNSTKNKRKRNK